MIDTTKEAAIAIAAELRSIAVCAYQPDSRAFYGNAADVVEGLRKDLDEASQQIESLRRRDRVAELEATVRALEAVLLAPIHEKRAALAKEGGNGN